MRKMKRAFALLLAATMMLSLLASCATAETPTSNPDPTGTTASTAEEYPIEPEELGSSEPKWSEEKTDDGWMKVTNEGGATLGYSPDSGVKLIQVGGFAFKDLNKNGKLDLYEDWRQEADDRARDLAGQLPAEQCVALMMHPEIFTMAEDGSDAFLPDGSSFMPSADEGIRLVLSHSSAYSPDVRTKWNNNLQAHVEALDWGIPFSISTNPLNWSNVPGNLALAATFDSDLVHQLSSTLAKQYRAVGISTLLGPQMDLASEPRWSRIDGTFGEDPALSRDMANAMVSGYQSTYDADGNDLGWGAQSVVAMAKHFPSDGAGESGREAHTATGKYNVYPGNAFTTGLIPFFDGAFNLDSATNASAAVMLSYSIAWSDDGSLGDLVGSAYSTYKIDLLRNHGYDGLIVTDFGVTKDEGSCYGVEDMTEEERCYAAIKAGVDQIGDIIDVSLLTSAYELLTEDIGAEAALARVQDSARRVVRTFFYAGLFENPYVSFADAAAANNEENNALGLEAQTKSIVMLKNANGAIGNASENEKPTVYIPMRYTPSSSRRGIVTPASWNLPVDLKAANEHFNVITDVVGEPTGEKDADGNPTLTADDIIRATAEELAACDYAIVFVNNPKNVGAGYDAGTETYIPISLQYGPYCADSTEVRNTSIAGDTVAVEAANAYGVFTNYEPENRAYYGQTSKVSNYADLEGILYTAENMPEDAPVIVAVNTTNPMIFSEFEDQADAILVGFGINNEVFLDIAAGKTEPSGLLPFQMPANMETVEAQYEDVPRDMECYVDSNGNTYDFGFGLNWSGVIQDARTAKYCVPALTAPAN